MNWRSYAASWKEFDLYYDRLKPGPTTQYHSDILLLLAGMAK